MERPDLADLNPPQRAAVLYGDGPLVVFAGAGSGKTRVITRRIANLITHDDVYPWRILAVTFTNKAAGEMRERLRRLVPDGADDLWMGTFHSVCARLLRRYAEPLALRRDFTIYDDQDQQAVIKRVLKDLDLDPKRYNPKSLAGAINRAKQEVRGPDQVDLDSHFEEIAQKVYAAYDEVLGRAGALDFGDLIYRMVVGLEANPSLCHEIASRFRYILVDEFQDTNHAQFRLVKALASVHGNLCVVGDDDQSIYRWRGADRRNILDFRRSYPTAEIIKLEQNYRSTKRILRAAHHVIRRNIDREPKELFTDNEEGEHIQVVACYDQRDEANTLVHYVQQALAEGDGLDAMAVLYRTHAQSRALEEALRAADLPYRVIGGVRFYDRAEVKDLLAYLRVVHNPDDDVSVLRILNTPSRGIGKTSADRLLDIAAEQGEGVWGAIKRVRDGDDARLGKAPTKRVTAFCELIEGFMEDAKSGSGTARDLAGDIAHRTGYIELLEKQDTPEADARLQNLGELLGSVELFEREECKPEQITQERLALYLERVSLQTQADEAGQEGEKLTMMTVHAAKGLEFPTVFVPGLEEELFPRAGRDDFEDPEELEEERRLAYVAFTRAEERLILMHAASRVLFGSVRVCSPSRFLRELPEEDVQQVKGLSAARYGSRGGSSGYGSRGGRGGYAGRSGGSSAGGAGWSRGRSSSRDYDDPYAAFRKSRETESAASGESYVDTSDGDFAETGQLHRGMRVFHSRYGVGEVRDLDMRADLFATVWFPEHGVSKKIKASYLRPA